MATTVYGIVKTVHQPTAVDACCNCHFFSHNEENLAIALSNWLHIYRLVSEDSIEKNSDGSSKQKLECAAAYHLFGNVESVSSLRLPNSRRDVLILSFKDAKLSVVEYDPLAHDLTTLSLHYFEEDALKSGLFSNYKKPVVRIDPDLRCATLLAYGCQLIILPLRKDLSSDDPNIIKSPFAPSYIIDLSKMDEKIHNLNDIQFLHGYYEPTLFILYEPIRTWAGRLPVRRDTCKIAAISLNMQEKVHPIIWSLDNLPFDCLRALALPKPIGGVLVFATTSIIYLNQSVPPYAASLTSLTNVLTQFPMKSQNSVTLTLDNSHSALIANDQVVISTKTGEIFVLTLCLDTMRSVKNFQFDKAASSVLPSCICLIGDGFLFLGSRLGNSLLLKYLKSSSASPNVTQSKSVIEIPKKDEKNDWFASDAADLEKELDELEVYGAASENQGGDSHMTVYQFQVCDSLMNIAPCGRICLGEPAFLSEELTPLCQVDHDLELVSTSGYGKNGALTFLQRTIRPQIITTFQLPEIHEIWTVKGPLNSDNVEQEQQNSLDVDMHSYLILGKEDCTMILQATDDISELDHGGFNTQTYTVFAGNIGDKYTVQVTAKSIRLLFGVKLLQNIPVDFGCAVCSASVSDPYLLIISEMGSLMLLQLKLNDDEEARLTVLKQPSDINAEATAASLYTDVSGIFSCERKSSDTVYAPHPVTKESQNRLSLSEETQSQDTYMGEDEDELLYGESEGNIPDLTKTVTVVKEKDQGQSDKINRAQTVITRNMHSSTHWAFVANKDGQLQIFSVPDFKLMFAAKSFGIGQKVIVDTETDVFSKESDVKVGPITAPPIKELLVTALGAKKHKPYIFARTINQALYVYEVMPSEYGAINRLQILLRRFNHNLLLRERRRVAKKRQADAPEEIPTKYAKQLIHTFENIGGYSGVVIGGPYPHWFILSSKGILRCHPMGIDGGIVCMAAFHNINCPRGFIYFNKLGELRIAILPAHISYEHQWPLRKVPMKTTVHYVQYDPDSKVYIVICSKKELYTKLVKIENDEKLFINQERDERFAYPTKDQYFMQLFSPINCEKIPGTVIEGEDCEAFTSLQIVSLSADDEAPRNFIGVSTNNSFNEEVTSKGRILIYEIIEVVPEPGLPLTKNKLKEIYAKEQKGPVTAISCISGMLIAAIGQKIYVYQLKDNELIGASFIDTLVYIHQMVSIKNLVLVADIHMSISVLRYQSEHRVLSTVCRDIKPMEVYAIEFLVDNTMLGFVATDRDQNLSIYMYQPDIAQTTGGSLLIRKADINIGSCVNSLCRVRCKLTDPTTDKKFSGVIEKKHVTYYATTDGAIGYVLALTERVYRRLDMIQRILYTSVPHTAGLNPKTYRSVRNQMKMLQNAQHNIIDGDLVWKYLTLPQTEQAHMAKRMGTTPDQIIEDLIEIDRVTTHF